MATFEQRFGAVSISSLSSNDSSIDQPHQSPHHSSHPPSDDPIMLPSMKKRFRAFCKGQRKLPQGSSASSQCQHNISPSTTALSSSETEDHSPVTIAPHDPSPEEPTRKRDRIQQWLVHHAQRLDRIKHRAHRDSMFDEADLVRELTRASQEVNATVSGPDGEPIDQRVIDHFFLLYQACGSNWRDSTRWERHQARCLRRQCDICRTPVNTIEGFSLPLKAPLPPPKDPKPLTESTSSDDGHLSMSTWRPRSRKREEKGKWPAAGTDEEAAHALGKMVHPKTQAQENQTERFRRISRRPRGNVVIRETFRRTQRKPVICSVVPYPLDSSRIPVPAVPDLKPASSAGLDLRNLAHATGRPYEGCPLDEGCLPFPLAGRTYLPPTTPKIKPAPAPLHLKDSSPASSDERIFHMSPPASPDLTPTYVQRGFHSTIRLVEAPTDEVRNNAPHAVSRVEQREAADADVRTLINDLSHDVSQPRPRRQPNADTLYNVVNKMHRVSAPITKFPPTPPDSRPNSASCAADVVNKSYGGVVTAAQPEQAQDKAACKLSDTTGEMLPDCPVYESPRDSWDRRWAGTARGRGPAGR